MRRLVRSCLTPSPSGWGASAFNRCSSSAEHRDFAAMRHCPVVGRAALAASGPQRRALAGAMFKWFTDFSRGQRASDRQGPAPAVPKRDRTLEAVIAHQRIALLFQPQIDPADGAILGVEALARWDGAQTAQDLFARAAAAGLSERLSRMIQRKALRTAATWEGALKSLHLSINLLPQDLARAGYDQWLLEEIEAAGIEARRITVEITESALLSDSDEIAPRLARLRAA